MAGQSVKAGYWFSKSQLPASNISANLFTHLFCAHAGLNPTTHAVTISDSEKSKIAIFSTTVKQSNPSIKTLLSIGGDDAKADQFSQMVGLPGNRKTFIDSSIAIARQYKFDGLDVQWLYPSTETEMNNLSVFLYEWQQAVVNESQKFHLPQLLLVATVFYSPYRGSILYPVETIRKTMNWVNVFAFDFYTPTSSNNQTGPSSAFYNPKKNDLSADFGTNVWIQEGLPAQRIVLGFPLYGWAWKLQNAEDHIPFSPASGAATGTDISADGLIEYWNVKKFINDNHANIVPLDREYVIAYTYKTTIWIGYENEESITIKISKAKALKLLGYYAWNLAGDDEYNTLTSAASREWGTV